MSHVCYTENCEICEVKFRPGDLVFDARTMSGRWGTLCRNCFHSHGISLGTGNGQKYIRGVEEKIGG